MSPSGEQEAGDETSREKQRSSYAGTMTQPPPSFDEWVRYCFTQGYRDFSASPDWGDPDYEEYEKREQDFLCLDPQVLAGYLIRLLQNPEFVADQYSDDQISDGVWFLFGIASEYFHAVRSDKVANEAQVECIKSVESMYLRLFDRVCCRRGADPDGEYTDELKVDIAVYMIWDMDGGLIMFQDKGLSVLENVLLKCQTSSCLQSALHGLGHIHHYHPRRCEQIIDRFLRERRAPDWVVAYARQARTGQIL